MTCQGLNLAELFKRFQNNQLFKHHQTSLSSGATNIPVKILLAKIRTMQPMFNNT
jgi:hypothetical protein